MEIRNVKITLDKAREWYNSDDNSLKEIALQAFNKDELTYNFKDITSFKKACNALNLDYDIISIVVKDIATYSRASAAMFKLNIVRKALNLGQDLYLTKDPRVSYTYYPYCPFMTKTSIYYKNVIALGEMEVIGKIKSGGEEYDVLGGDTVYGNNDGLGCFISGYNIGVADANIGFLGCANKEIAQHFSKYFGMLITEAKYGDLLDFKIIEQKYS